jgi:N-acetylneuraminic acid mutarotase
MMLPTFMLLFSQLQAPVIPNTPAIFAEDRLGHVYLLVDTKPRTVLVWNGQKMAKIPAANWGEVTLIRAGREALPLNSSLFPGQITRDQHVNGWRLAHDPQNPKTSRIEVRPAGADTWQTPLDPEAVMPVEYQTIVGDDIGYIWISTRTNVLCLDPRKPKNAWTWTAPQPVTALGLSPNGRALAGLADGQLYELGRGPRSRGVSQPYTVQQLPAKPIRAIHTDGEGSVWVVVEKGVFRASSPAESWQRHWRPLARMPVGNHDIFSGQLDGKLYVFGGMGNYGYPAKYTYFNDLFVFDVRANRWEVVSRLDPPRCYNGCAALAGRIWVIGGRLFAREPIPIDRVDIYDPKTSNWEEGPKLPTPRSESVVVPVQNRIYVIGGISGKTEPRTYDTLSIGPGEKTWRAEPAPPGGTISQSSGCVLDGNIYTFSPWANCVLRYDPVNHTWEKLPPPPGDMTLSAAVCGAHQGEVWIMGGNTDKQLSFIYSPKNNSWRAGPDLPTALGWTSAQDVDGRLIITPGGIATKQLADFIFTDKVYELRSASDMQKEP